MWERRLELKKQAKKSIEQDFNKDDLETLRNEVHKLQVKHAWLIDFAHFRENCPTGIIPEWLIITG